MSTTSRCKSALLLAAFCGSPVPLAAADQVLIVGLYKDSGKTGLAYTFDGTANLSPLASSSIGAGPSWIIAARDAKADSESSTRNLFAVSETGNTVASLSLDCAGRMVETSRVSSEGDAPVFLAFDPGSDTLLVAEYGAGNLAVFPVAWNAAHATLTAASQVVKFGSDAHAHSAYFNPQAMNAVFVPTLGLDKVQQLSFRGGKLSQAHAPLSVPAQQGPRHLAFHPSLPIAVLANEGSATANVTIELLAVSQEMGLSTLATYKAAGPYHAPDLYPAEVLFSKNGNYVLVSVRDATDQKRDGVAVFKVDADGKSLSFVQYASVGHYPRSMALADSGLLIVGNQKGNSLSFLSLDDKTGKLTKAKDDLQLTDSPAFVGIFDLPSACAIVI